MSDSSDDSRILPSQPMQDSGSKDRNLQQESEDEQADFQRNREGSTIQRGRKRHLDQEHQQSRSFSMDSNRTLPDDSSSLATKIRILTIGTSPVPVACETSEASKEVPPSDTPAAVSAFQQRAVGLSESAAGSSGITAQPDEGNLPREVLIEKIRKLLQEQEEQQGASCSMGSKTTVPENVLSSERYFKGLEHGTSSVQEGLQTSTQPPTFQPGAGGLSQSTTITVKSWTIEPRPSQSKKIRQGKCTRVSFSIRQFRARCAPSSMKSQRCCKQPRNPTMLCGVTKKRKPARFKTHAHNITWINVLTDYMTYLDDDDEIIESEFHIGQ